MAKIGSRPGGWVPMWPDHLRPRILRETQIRMMRRLLRDSWNGEEMLFHSLFLYQSSDLEYPVPLYPKSSIIPATSLSSSRVTFAFTSLQSCMHS